MIDASILAYYGEDYLLVTNHRYIFRRFIKNYSNIIYRLIILFPFYSFEVMLGYIRILMFVEYEDLNLLVRGTVKLVKVQLFRSSVR